MVIIRNECFSLEFESDRGFWYMNGLVFKDLRLISEFVCDLLGIRTQVMRNLTKGLV